MNNQLTLSECKAIIRNARNNQGYKFGSPLAAFLYDSDWMSCCNFEGSLEGFGWAGAWTLSHPLDGELALFRECRDTAVTCVVLYQDDSGFVSAWAETRPADKVEKALNEEFYPGCFSCCATIPYGEGLEIYDAVYCENCACECDVCGQVALTDDCILDVIDQDTGEQGRVCSECIEVSA
jgi:hypothetical protein